MTDKDPWADVRREFKDVGDPFVDRLLADADALLAVVRDQLPKVHNPELCLHNRIRRAEIGEYMDTHGPPPCEVCDAVAALPKHLRAGESDE